MPWFVRFIPASTCTSVAQLEEQWSRVECHRFESHLKQLIFLFFLGCRRVYLVQLKNIGLLPYIKSKEGEIGMAWS